MIRENVKFYQSMDAILCWSPPWNETEQKSLFPWSVVGIDEKGGPIVHIPFGRWCLDAITGKRDEMIRVATQYFEKVWRMMLFNSRGKEFVAQFSIIIDMEGLGWRTLTYVDALQVGVHMIKLFEANYPETLRVAVLVNAPSIFPAIWKLIKPILSEATHAKVQFVECHQRKESREMMGQFISKDILPEKYGGYVPNNKAICVDRNKDLFRGYGVSKTDSMDCASS